MERIKNACVFTIQKMLVDVLRDSLPFNTYTHVNEHTHTHTHFVTCRNSDFAALPAPIDLPPLSNFFSLFDVSNQMSPPQRDLL